ncbi:hypothetical protein pp2_259 [Vibrio phage phi-pp2]|uniref:Uncharacterized protein n=1 Tax=Vibrio phage phi-pp2 TaxID=1204514 RepID=I6X2M3_9CAUD|nr:hypothetical protein pp2_259 [Vibrio phage phi-pp2]
MGDAIIVLDPLLKLARNLRRNRKKFHICVPLAAFMVRGQLKGLIEYVIQQHDVQDNVTVVDYDELSGIDNDFDLYVHYSTSLGGYLYNNRQFMGAKRKVTSKVKEDNSIDYTLFDDVIDTTAFAQLNFPLWAHYNEVNRQILERYFDISCDAIRYSLELDWNSHTPVPNPQRSDKTFMFHVCDDMSSSARWDNSDYIKFIKCLNSQMKNLPKISFVVHNNEDSVREIVNSIDNDVEYIQGELKDIAEHINNNVHAVFTHSTGILHLAAALSCTTVELSRSQQKYHGIEWCPPCRRGKHFIISPRFFGWDDLVDIDIELASKKVYSWMFDRLYCPIDDTLSAYRTLYSTILEMETRISKDDLSTLAFAIDNKINQVNNFKF